LLTRRGGVARSSRRVCPPPGGGGRAPVTVGDGVRWGGQGRRARRGPVRRRLRSRADERHRAGDRQRGTARRGAALPAPLPGRARRGRVPAVVRGGERSVRQAARYPGAAPGHNRAWRRDLHDACDRARACPHPHDDHHDQSAWRLWSMTTTAHPELEGLDRYKFGWADSDAAGESARRGLSEEVVRDISARKNEPEWMLDLRLKGLKLFGRKPTPDSGADLTGIDFDNIKYF